MRTRLVLWLGVIVLSLCFMTPVALATNRSDCIEWCQAHSQCAMCSTRRNCGPGYTDMRNFTGRGRNYSACRPWNSDYGRGSEDNRQRCFDYCNSEEGIEQGCYGCSTLSGCLPGNHSIRGFRGPGVDWFACREGRPFTWGIPGGIPDDDWGWEDSDWSYEFLVVQDNKKEPMCGNNRTEDGELCDADIMCSDLTDLGVPTQGMAYCNDTCDDLDISFCFSCGDGIKQRSEVCEVGDEHSCAGIIIPGQTSLEYVYTNGTLTCRSDCMGWNYADCSGSSSMFPDGFYDDGGKYTYNEEER